MAIRSGHGSSNIIGKLWRGLFALPACLLLSCHSQPIAPVQTVDPTHYDSFFLWAGVKPPKVLDQAKSVYLLAGELRKDDASHIVPLRATPQTQGEDNVILWLTIRAERLDWKESTYQQLFNQMQSWEAAGNHLAGLQIDFDAATLKLGDYAEFLKRLRQRLPKRYKLSVTGLMDWSSGDGPDGLRRVSASVDEVVIQTYQGRVTVPDYTDYREKLSRLDVPFRLALVEGGEWQEPANLESNAQFLGYVIFLLPQKL
ncbi:DUF3142 domain-containing protein [Altererythrobacter indicus]|uniref:DUF3142 domain-containing protein n=1 Tax=Altericroceibacterium indicum TaxID=374177 RepID=A0A845A888_9SPHN|nr:DUF3142 domain-containing protein [Altericroceibacterium indicum]MXP25539.1 DUF3142 domain-containing protein [Altericroceibacterium indicum]